MKRFGNLFQSIVSLQNLQLASFKAQKGKLKKKEVIEWNYNLEENIWKLHKELQNKTYKVSKYSLFTIYEPKERNIAKLPFRDRVVHHAIMNYLAPIFTKGFITQTYSCIKKRGIHKCLNDLKRGLKNKKATPHVLKCDIHKFYPSINHEILKSQLRRKLKDKNLLELLDKIIESAPGVPIGNFTSQWFSNFYLNEFDHWLKENKRVKYYFRYCDDFVILGENKEHLHELRKEISIYLKEKLKLQLSNYQVFPVKSRGIDFIGYVTYHTHVKLRKSIKNRFKEMMRKRPNEKSINSYLGWTMHANCRNLEKKILNDHQSI